MVTSRKWRRLAFLLCTMSIGSPVGAAQVIQSLNLDHVSMKVSDLLAEVEGNDLRSISLSVSETYIFNGFDNSLGTLTGASIAITSHQEHFYGVSIADGTGDAAGARVLLYGNSGLKYSVGSATILENRINRHGLAACVANNENICIDFETETQSVSREVGLPDLLVYREGPFAMTMEGSSYVTSYDYIPGRPLPLVTSVQRLRLGGTAILTYDYTPFAPPPPPVPTNVPEPSTWAMLILGFGVIGSAARRRHAVRVAFA